MILCRKIQYLQNTIYEFLEKSLEPAGGLESFRTCVINASLANTLKSEGPFTVFAPLNGAFGKLPDDELEDILKPGNGEKLKTVIIRHIIPYPIMSDELPLRNSVLNLQTAGEEKIELTANDEQVTITSKRGRSAYLYCRYCQTDIALRNGVIHIINDVL